MKFRIMFIMQLGIVWLLALPLSAQDEYPPGTLPPEVDWNFKRFSFRCRENTATMFPQA